MPRALALLSSLLVPLKGFRSGSSPIFPAPNPAFPGWRGSAEACDPSPGRGSSGKGEAFDLVACATTRSCRAKYDRGVMALLARGGCPPCLDAMHQAALAGHSESTLDDDNGLVYCVGP